MHWLGQGFTGPAPTVKRRNLTVAEMLINHKKTFQQTQRLYSNNAGEISRQLASQCETVAEYLLPAGRRVTKHWVAGDVYGSAGDSLKVLLVGERAGRWQDFATDEHGDLLDLWQLSRGLDSSGAFREACGYLGHTDHTPKPTPAPHSAASSPSSLQ